MPTPTTIEEGLEELIVSVEELIAAIEPKKNVIFETEVNVILLAAQVEDNAEFVENAATIIESQLEQVNTTVGNYYTKAEIDAMFAALAP